MQPGESPSPQARARGQEPAAARPQQSPRRAVVEAIGPLVDAGRFPAKAAIGDDVVVEANAFCDGHDLLACEVRFQHEGEGSWHSEEMAPLGNDRWRGTFRVEELGRYRFTVRAGVDRYATWLRGVLAWAAAGQDCAIELRSGGELLAQAASRARAGDRRVLSAVAGCLAQSGDLGAPLPPNVLAALDSGDAGMAEALEHDVSTMGDLLRSESVRGMMRRYRPSTELASSSQCMVLVEPERARFSTWYELFPRSASPVEGRPGTLADVRARLDYVERLGADVLYLPPIHPIGTTGRKGRDGSIEASPDDPGSPWAIGSPAGGHTAVDPGLGTIDDLDRLVATAEARGIAVALDLAFQCSPDHPWVHEHPEWFRHRSDGSIRYAENPPKRYEDIYPLDFETDQWWDLWLALFDVVQFWISHGIRVFRVDNPHTKPFAFWEWLISTVRERHPEVVFLSEAFTRPSVMYRLAKLGFSQSYTYFAWRHTKWDLESYVTELSQVRDFFRPNFWPNTPDILTEELQQGGMPAFVTRLVLAATLAASYGIYGPAFELQEHAARSPGSEEYAGSEKYEVRHWDLDRSDSLAALVSRLNQIRRQHPALQRDDTLRLHQIDNDQLLAYSKTSGDDAVLVVVNLDHRYRQSGWVDLGPFAPPPGEALEVHDLLTDAHYRWEGSHNFVLLDPAAVPAHVLSVRATGQV
ncbi:MAG: maltotransferase domain-containing protein [Acidimicrobiales bacterium]